MERGDDEGKGEDERGLEFFPIAKIPAGTHGACYMWYPDVSASVIRATCGYGTCSPAVTV